MYQMSFVVIANGNVIHKWTCSEKFSTKEDAMKFAQNVAKSFNGTDWNLYYRIVH